MRRATDDAPRLRVPVACCVAAVVALSLGPTGEAAVRAGVRDLAKPGFLCVRWIALNARPWDFGRWPWTAAATVSINAPTAGGASPEIDREVRALRAELAETRRRFEELDASLGPVRSATSGAQAGVARVRARLLSDAADNWLVSAGRSADVAADLPVVEPLPVAAAGEADGVAAGNEILAGAAVVGRIDEAGVWASTVRPITDPAFRAYVRIVRESGGTTAAGDDGVLEGDGRGGCVVKYVASTAAVATGDHVYSRDPSGRLPRPLYYGRIERAELRDGAPYWDLRVRPAVDPATLAEVTILRPVPAPERIAGRSVLAN